MNKNLNKLKSLYFLYIIGSIGIILFLLKVFTYGYSGFFNTNLVEIILLLIFVSLLFYSDKVIRNICKEANIKLNSSNENYKKLEAENLQLKEKIKEFEDKENEALRLSSYRDIIIQQITQKKIKDKHNLLHLLAEIFQAGVIVLYKEIEQKQEFDVEATYAVPENFEPSSFKLGEGLNGQAAKDGKPMVVDNIESEYIAISSGLGKTEQGSLYLLPVMKDDKCIYLIEMLAFVEEDVSKVWLDLSNKLVEKEIL